MAALAPPPPMMRLEEALDRMLAGVEPLPAEPVDLAKALGLVLAEPRSARHTLPPWDNSAMDGFAVRAADVGGAAGDRPVRLAVAGEVAAGSSPSGTVQPGQALRILTGAPVPPGADAVVPVEDTDAPLGAAVLPTTVEIRRSVEPGAHIRRRGSDLREGDPLLEVGIRLGAVELAIAAAGGHGRLPAHRRPVVAVLATGDELVPPGADLGPAQIPESNTVALIAQAREAGAQAKPLGIAPDRLEVVTQRLREGIEQADVVVVSGGVSVGAHDVVKDAFAALGKMDLWRVAVQPGKPLAFARAVDPGTGRQVLLFGLPGNPVSSFVTFELFVRPIIRRLAGHADPLARDIVRARLAEPVTKAPGRRAFLRVRLTRGAAEVSEGWLARLTGGQGSHVLSALAAADGLAVVPEEVEGLPAGTDVEVIVLRRGVS